MYKIALIADGGINEYEELIKLFLRPEEFQITRSAEADLVFGPAGDNNELKRQIYKKLKDLTGAAPPWGILTGVRPVKMAGKIVREAEASGSSDPLSDALDILNKTYLISDEKARLALEIYQLQQRVFGRPENNSVSVYIGIPFCPTRCLYCSFASNQREYGEIERYMTALYREMRYVAAMMSEKGLHAESIYIGGGTPTSLNDKDFDTFLAEVNESFYTSSVREFTVEMGRPDTVTENKLRSASLFGVNRISINPQTMKDETLALIGRDHGSDDIIKAFDIAKKYPELMINADLIAGLPGETECDFAESLGKVRALDPENITVHSLSVKRASKLVEIDKDMHYKQGAVVSAMLDRAGSFLREYGYIPYYLYRQKHMSGAQENTGYALPGTESLYNVRIMDECQTIIGMGAAGMTKVYFPAEDRLERVPNVSNYEIYIERIDEMINRKKEGLFNAD